MPTTVGTTTIDHGWHHYAYVRAANVHEIYLDGVLEITVSDQPMSSLGPGAIIAYMDGGPTGVTPAPRMTGTKMWEAPLTAAEIVTEMTDYVVVRTNNAYQEAHLASASDLTDSFGNNNDWGIDPAESGALATKADGPNGAMPTSISVDIADSPTGVGFDGVALAILENMPLNFQRSFTAMGWWRAPDHTDETSLFLFSNTDQAGGPGISINLQSGASRKVYIDFADAAATGGTVAIVATPSQPAPPLPSTVNLVATATVDASLTVGTYAWTLVSGPATPTISTPAASSTDVIFTTYDPGTYVFRVSVTTTNTETGDTAVPLVASISLLIPTSSLPTIENGSEQTTYPTGVTLAPTIDSAGWDGTPTYAWTQESGPGAATIVTPAAATTDITFPGTQGTYVFKLTVTEGAYVGEGLRRVTVLTGAVTGAAMDLGTATITVNGSPGGILANSPTINESLDPQPNTCSFRVYMTMPIAVGNRIIITHGSAGRLFAGVVMRANRVSTQRVGIQITDVQANGPEWDMGRRRVTKVYENMSASSIASDLIGRVPGFSASVQGNLPTIARIAFDKARITDALTELAAQIDGAHWKSDYFNNVEFAIVSSATSPEPVTVSFNALSFSSVRDISRTVNRLRVSGVNPPNPPENPSSPGSSEPVTELEVSSLDNYSPTGGKGELNGQEFTYTGTDTRRVGSIGPGSGVSVQVYINAVSMQTPGGQLLQWSFPISGTNHLYAATLTTTNGESTAVAQLGWPLNAPSNAIQIRVLVDPYGITAASPTGREAIRKITGVKLYRYSVLSAPSTYRLITSLGARGGVYVDETSDRDELYFAPEIPGSDTSGTPSVLGSEHYFLTGITGLTKANLGRGTNPTPPLEPTKYVFTLDDTGSQSEMAALLGDDGVIEGSYDAGTATQQQAEIAARVQLQQQALIQVQVEYTTFDYKARPGGIVPISVTDDRNIIGDFMIQNTVITDFASGSQVPPRYRVTATKKLPLVRFENFLRRNVI